MKIAVVKETYPGERRVALVPAVLNQLQRAGIQTLVEAGAGTSAGYEDDEYQEKGALIVASRAEAFTADAVAQVRALGANPDAGSADLGLMRAGQLIMGTCDPLGNPQAIREIANRGATLLALELMPRITRAQTMDVLSSMATIAGYRAVLIAAAELPKLFPLMMTAAGTISPARVFVIGAGVAGLQAIATSRRLGAVVQAYDVRPAVREQVESLGAKFVELNLEAGDAEDQDGYAKTLGEDFYTQQRELLADVVAGSDVVLTTAAIPGKPSPLLITAAAVERMARGSVIVDLAAERGGNCELTKADQRTVEHGVTILGPTNLPSEIPYHASQMFSTNVATLLLHLVQDGKLHLDMQDAISRETTVAAGGEVTNLRIRELLGMEPIGNVAEKGAETEESLTSEAGSTGETSTKGQ